MRLKDLDTPCVVIDLDRAEANLARGQAVVAAAGLAMRPHVKTHKLPCMALRQIALGAVGVTCQKLGEAEAMADGGIGDIFVPYNILGATKLARLAALHARVVLSVTADSAQTVAGYAAAFTDPAHPLAVLVECDTGMGRCGVREADGALALARQIAAAPGLRFGGLMSYPARGQQSAADAWMAACVARIQAAGLAVPVVSLGGTPDLMAVGGLRAATEYRPGTYIYSDRMQVAFGHGTFDDCALTVRATVVSRPTPTRAVLDAGSKALAADLCSLPGHGHIPAYPQAVITSLSEEHAVVDLAPCAARPQIGEVVAVIPNHACVVSNLFDRVWLARGDAVTGAADVTSRGRLA
ncbi:MAG: D-TA family PLP-dependent enzyme [Rhodobacterales bacterium]|nr:D-TA family PLP-dependent enzyme [Rhodobacterales bacterium]